MAESLVDSFKTELIADRVWRTRSQLEFAIAAWVGWYNGRRLHSARSATSRPSSSNSKARRSSRPPCSADLDQTALRAADLNRGAGRAETDAS